MDFGILCAILNKSPKLIDSEILSNYLKKLSYKEMNILKLLTKRRNYIITNNKHALLLTHKKKFKILIDNKCLGIKLYYNNCYVDWMIKDFYNEPKV